MSAPVIELSLGLHTFRFSSASTLRDALLGSFADASYAGGPFIVVDRENTTPAWSWLLDLIRARTDWWECAGIAFQHAVADGEDLARTAAADFLARHYFAPALLPWTDVVAKRWPDVRASFGPVHFVPDDHEPRIADIIAEHKKWLAKVGSPDRHVVLWSFNVDGSNARAPLKDAADLRSLLERTAQAGYFHDDDGPWGWLKKEILHRKWLADELPQVVAQLIADERLAFALLDWLLDGWDAWRFDVQLAAWLQNPPSWSSLPVKHKPSGWKRPIRSATYLPDVATLRDVVDHLHQKTQFQLITRPVVDLDAL